MTKDPDKLKSPPGLEKLKLPRIDLPALQPEQKLLFEQIGRENLATKMRGAGRRLRQEPPKPKGYDAPRRNVLCSIMRERFGPNGPPDNVSTYELVKQIKPLWAEAWRRQYPERKLPLPPCKGTVADARATLKNLPR